MIHEHVFRLHDNTLFIMLIFATVLLNMMDRNGPIYNLSNEVLNHVIFYGKVIYHDEESSLIHTLNTMNV